MVLPSLAAWLTDVTLWLAPTVLGLTVVVYAVTQTFLLEVQRLIEAERTIRLKEYRKRLVEILDRLKKPSNSGMVDQAEKDLRKKMRTLKRELASLESLPQAMHVKSVVLVPGGLMVAAIVMAARSKVGDLPLGVSLGLAGTACLAVAVGLTRLCVNLVRLQKFAGLLPPRVITTAQYNPKWKTGQPNRITIHAVLERGAHLSSFQTVLYVPPCFRSTAELNEKLKLPADHPKMPNYYTIPSREFPVLKTGLPFVYDYDRLTCQTPGRYTLYYRVVSAQYSSEDKEILVEVEP